MRITGLISLIIFTVSIPVTAGQDEATEARTPSAIERLSMRLLDENDLDADYRALVKEFKKEVEQYDPPCLLKRISRILNDPFALESVTLNLRDGLEERAAAGLEGLPDLLVRAAGVIDAQLDAPDAAPTFDGEPTPDAHLDYIEAVFDRAAQSRSEAFVDLEPGDAALSYEVLAEVLEKFIDGVYLESDAEDEQLWRYSKGLKRLAKINYAKMVEASAILAALSHPDYLDRIRGDLDKFKAKAGPEAGKAGFSGDVLAFRETRHGPLVIGGKRTTKYKGKAAFVIDLGGKDTYNTAASTLDEERGLSMVIDLEGNDKYQVKATEGLAAARLGVSMLIDLEGNDLYDGKRITQGFAAGGVALLWDEAGKDRYKSAEYAQGGGFFGVGLCVDRGGADTYNAYLHAQGFAMPGGFGALIDLDGDDVYTATGKYPSTYGVKGVYHAASQGHGTGFRRYENRSAPSYAGGIGLLLDAAGDDEYEAGNFSQGCGYFFGCGMLVDHAGDDIMKGSRYTQGSGAHQSAGIVVNDAGDDTYEAIVAANQAGTWDITAGMLLDFEGDDTYEAQDLAQAGSAQTGFALLFDGEGKDTYRAKSGSCQGGTGGFEYHEKPSISILLDLGGDKDSYSRPKRKDNSILLHPWNAVFADFRQKTLDKALELDSRKLKGEWGAPRK